MNWGDLKYYVLQKMFALSGTAIVLNSNTTAYINSMPQVANEGLQLLTTAGKHIIKSVDITQDGTDTGFVQKYDLKTLVDDFYSLGNNKVFFQDDESYKQLVDYTLEGSSTFVIPSSAIGTWTIYYNAYPQTITSDTLDDVVITLDAEVSALLPLYMASQLYKEDDIALATTWRNEFEAGIEKLVTVPIAPTIEFMTELGW